MLEREGIAHRYRDYRQEPLSEAEIRSVLKKLGARPAEVLRTRDRANASLGLTGEEPDDRLIALMAANPTLLQRPIGVSGERAALGRPPENLLKLVRPGQT